MVKIIFKTSSGEKAVWVSPSVRAFLTVAGQISHLLVDGVNIQVGASDGGVLIADSGGIRYEYRYAGMGGVDRSEPLQYDDLLTLIRPYEKILEDLLYQNRKIPVYRSRLGELKAGKMKFCGKISLLQKLGQKITIISH